MKEPDEWEKRNIVFYLKLLLKKKHHRLQFEQTFKFDFSYNLPTLNIDAKSYRRTDFSNIAIEHKVLSLKYILKKEDTDFYYYTITVSDAESLTQLLLGSRLFILKILNEHCLHNQMRLWTEAQSSTGNKEVYFYISQEPAPKQETESEKEQRKRLITDAGSKIWRFLTGEPIKNSVSTCDKSLVDGSLSHEHVNGVGLVLILKQPNLKKLNILAMNASHEKLKKLPPKPPSPKIKLHYSDDEDKPKHVTISDKTPKVIHFAKSSNAMLFKPPSLPLNKPAPPIPLLKTPGVPLAKLPVTDVMQPPAPAPMKPNAILNKPIPKKAPTVPTIKTPASSQKPAAAKRPYSMLDVPAKQKPYFLVKVDEILEERKERKARELKRRNRGEDDKDPVLHFSGKQIPK